LFGIADDYDDLPGSLEVKVDRELIDDFLKDLEKHEKALRESRELLEKNRDMKKVSGVYEATVDNYYSNIINTADYSQ